MSSPFPDLDDFIALPRVVGLALSPDGTRLVTGVATLNGKSTGHRTALWQLDPEGEAPARRLTRSRKGESAAVFTSSGDLLFTSSRPDPDDEDEDDDRPAALWLLPAEGGEARLLVSRTGGVGTLRTKGDTLLMSADRLPAAATEADDEKLRKQRKDGKVSAILHRSHPVRDWDRDAGPGADHLLRATITDDGAERPALTDLTPSAQRLEIAGFDLSPDATFAVVSQSLSAARGQRRNRLVRLDLAAGTVTTLVDDPSADALDPVISPDGTRVAFAHDAITAPDRPPHVELHVLDLADGTHRRVAATWDGWAVEVRWLPDGSGLVLTADSDGRAPVFVLDLATDSVSRVSADDAAFTDPVVSPDGATVYALRSSYAAPPEVVRLDLSTARATGEPVPAVVLPSPVTPPALPGRLVEVETTAADGARVRAWLALPEAASPSTPAPLLLWIHGGPLSSWNAWSWRWCPWLLVAAGYAVLLPDPALSTGYGEAFIARGWGRWGAEPFTDLMASTDAAVARDDIDADRTAAMGGSFGGYMANWVAGHTDRFRAIVTHASLWALDGFGPTTDYAFYWERELDPAMTAEHSPHTAVGDIRTPMLVVHGDKDYRVPIGEGLRLWWDLLSRSALPMDDEGRTPHRFLYFPDENHWVLSPQHAKVWYGTVLAFLAEHLLETPLDYPEILGE